MPLGSLIRLALVQFAPVSGDAKANIATVSALCGAKKADVWLFPHLFATGAPGANEAYRYVEKDDGPSASFLKKLAIEKKGYAIGSYIAENPSNSLRPFLRTAIFNMDGQRVSVYDQIMLSSIQGEPDHFTPGEKMLFFDCFTFRSTVIGSYDLRFPELAREFGLSWGFFLFVQGAYPNDQIHHWDALLQARAAENQMFVIGCNFGNSKENISNPHSFGGHSAVYDPFGKKLHQAGEGDQVLILDIDPFQVEWNRNRYQYLTDSKMKLAHRFVYESQDDPDR